MLAPADYGDVEVTVAHPAGDVRVPLPEWIRVGPGPRPLTSIVAAHRISTGAEVPLAEIPAEYHNTRETRRLQREGHLPTPWGPPAAD
jgi:hypothetical protein